MAVCLFSQDVVTVRLRGRAITDLQTKVVSDASERQQFSVTAILSQTAAQREKVRAQLSLADPLEINAANRLFIAQWSYTPSPRALAKPHFRVTGRILEHQSNGLAD